MKIKLNNKKSYYIKIVLVVFVIIVLFYEYNPYNIKNNQLSIIQGIRQFTPTYNNLEIDIKSELDIANKKYVIFRTKKDILEAIELKKGLFGLYKIEFIATIESPDALSIITKTNHERYFVMIGNGSKNIDFVKITLEDQEIIFNVSNKDSYILYYPIMKIARNITVANIRSIIKVELLDDQGELIRTIPISGVQ